MGFFIAAALALGMRRLLWLGLVATALVATIVGGSMASFVSTNALFLDSPWATKALVSLGVVVVLVLALVVLAGPRRDWLSSPYW